jgi:hypothetical protein
MYQDKTKDKIVKYLIKHKSCFVSKLCYLGGKKMRIKYPVVREVVDDLIGKKLARIESTKFGKKTLYTVSWGKR